MAGRVDNDLEVLRASQIYGELVARTICAQHPELDVEKYTESCAAELFMAAKDMAECARVEAAQAGAQGC